MVVKLKTTRAQMDIIEHPAPIKVTACGRRWGKTILMALYLTHSALKYNNSINWYVTNNYARALGLMRMMARCDDFKVLVRKTVQQFPPRFELKNGSEIHFRSSDNPDSLRGEGLKLACMDEAAYAKQQVFFNVLLPMLSDNDGTALVGSTFSGRNWYFDLAEKGKNYKPGAEVKTWIFPTSSGVKFKGPRGKVRLERLRAAFPTNIWAQEYECEPLAQANAIFNLQDANIKGAPVIDGSNGGKFIVALDLGRTIDPTSIVVGQIIGQGREANVQVVHSESLPLGTPHQVCAQKGRQIADRYGYAKGRVTVICDSTGGGSGGHEESYVRFYRESIPNLREINWSRSVKCDMVNNMTLRVERLKVFIPAVLKELISQIRLYRYKIVKSALLPTYSAPDGEHDDELAGLLMILYAVEHNWIPVEGGYSPGKGLY